MITAPPKPALSGRLTPEQYRRAVDTLKGGERGPVAALQRLVGAHDDGRAGNITAARLRAFGPPRAFDWAAFYGYARTHLFRGALDQSQVDGLRRYVNGWFALSLGPGAWTSPERGCDRRHLAYVLATAQWETAHTMRPVREYGRGRGRKYGRPAGPYAHVYYGRGDVQLTWLANYQKQSAKLGLDLVKHPDLALRADVAARILIGGMLDGDFTGRSVLHYIDGSKTDYTNARRVVNGTDKMREIAAMSVHYERALIHAGR